jgi:hypothetical protein
MNLLYDDMNEGTWYGLDVERTWCEDIGGMCELQGGSAVIQLLEIATILTFSRVNTADEFAPSLK